jgi:outer membrane protein
MFFPLLLASILMSLVSVSSLEAQTGLLTISEAVRKAEEYPAVQASLEQIQSATAAIDLARTNYLPRADFLGQINRATRNNVFGLLFPQTALPSISGPVLGTSDSTNVWGSAVGMLVSWEPFDFGLRKANVQAAESLREAKTASSDVTRLQVGTAAADAFLTILASQQAMIAAQAGVDRTQSFRDAVEPLVRTGLKPGVDQARAEAELALAKNQLIQAQQANDFARATLSQFLGIAPSEISLDPGVMIQLPPEAQNAQANLAEHPLALEQQAAVEQVKARERVLDRSYFPTFRLQGAAMGRGTGARTDASSRGGVGGLAPTVGNWALGLTASFSAFDLPSLRARQQIEVHEERAQAARYEKTVDDLNLQLHKAEAQLRAARQIAANTPAQLQAAQAAEQQATARYRSGLSNTLEVADAQRLLTQAQIDDSLAKLNVWRSILAVAAAHGDLQSFLSLASQ